MATIKRVTLRDVARHAGFATGTVSMVLNSSPLVSDATREHVQRVIRELNYVYDRSAAQLRKKRTYVVGVSICNLLNPYFAEIATGIERSLSEFGRVIVLGNAEESLPRQERFLATLLEYNVEGLLLFPVVGTPRAAVKRLKERHVPIVMVSRYIPGLDIDYAGPDNRLGSLLAIRHLVSLGHRRIAFVGLHRRTSTGRDRIAGFRAGLREARLRESPELIIECDASRESGFRAVEGLFDLADPPTAIACFNDLVAFGVMLGLRHRGLEPGSDCSVVGVDNIKEAGLWQPGLTTVGVDIAGIGRAAGRLLRDRIEQPGGPTRRVIVEPHLAVRNSCGAPRSPRGVNRSR